MRCLFFPIVALAGIAACGPAKQDAAAKDPKAPALEPAVVSVPLSLPAPAADTATANKPGLIPQGQAKRETAVGQGYSLAAATMINQDARMLSTIYDPSAVLHAPDSTLTGGPMVVRHLLGLARATALADFQRTSKGMRIIDDSTFVDSGIYQMTLKRTTKDSVIERGRYSAKWRVRADVARWVILEDLIQPRSSPKKKGTK